MNRVHVVFLAIALNVAGCSGQGGNISTFLEVLNFANKSRCIGCPCASSSSSSAVTAPVVTTEAQ